MKGLKDNQALDLIKRIKSVSDKDGFINTNTLKTLDIGIQQITAKQIFEYLYITLSPDNEGKLGVKLKEIEAEKEQEIKAIIKKEFNYQISIADIKQAGITTTGKKGDSQLPDLLTAFTQYRKQNNLW